MLIGVETHAQARLAVLEIYVRHALRGVALERGIVRFPGKRQLHLAAQLNPGRFPPLPGPTELEQELEAGLRDVWWYLLSASSSAADDAPPEPAEEAGPDASAAAQE